MVDKWKNRIGPYRTPFFGNLKAWKTTLSFNSVFRALA